MDRTVFRMSFAAACLKDVIGQAEYLAAGTYTLAVPADVYTMCFAVVQGGQGGGDSYGGKGGDLRWANDIPVTPGENLTVTVGAAGAASFSSLSGGLGGHTTISRGATVLLSSATPLGVGVGGGDGGAQGTGQNKTGTYGTVKNGGGGGGAGGYSGNGGDGGGTAQPSAGSGGGGGGGGCDTSPANENPSLGFTFGSGGRTGGGVALKGEGASGSAGSNALSPTAGGSGSNGGAQATGRGGGGGYTQTAAGDDVQGDNGGPGGARAMWGFARSYPSTRTADE